MKTTFITLLLIVASAIASFANTSTAPQQARDYAIRSVHFTFDVNPANPDVQNLSCTFEIPDGTPDYHTMRTPVSNSNSVLFSNYNAPEELHMLFSSIVNVDVTVSSTEGPVQSYIYHSGNFVAIRCETPIQSNSRYEIHVRVGY